jgi:proteasome assembly chaperone (PAC2) family protein
MYKLTDHPALDAPVMISALAGWVDAAAVGTSAAARLAEDGRAIATFDPDALFHYRSQRPILDLVDGVPKRVIWPEVVLRHAQVEGRDLLVLTGQEPDLAWKGFSASIAELAHTLGVVQLITFGAVPAAVPHTLPAPVMTTASDIGLLKGDANPPEGLLRVPAAAVSLIDQEVAASGIPTVGFFVQVPHYVNGNYPAGVLALLSRVARHLDIEIPMSLLEEDARMHREQLDELIASQPEAQEFVARLESMNAEQRVVSGEELAAEIERYLKESPESRNNPFEEGGSEGPG